MNRNINDQRIVSPSRLPPSPSTSQQVARGDDNPAWISLAGTSVQRNPGATGSRRAFVGSALMERSCASHGYALPQQDFRVTNNVNDFVSGDPMLRSFASRGYEYRQQEAAHRSIGDPSIV